MAGPTIFTIASSVSETSVPSPMLKPVAVAMLVVLAVMDRVA